MKMLYTLFFAAAACANPIIQKRSTATASDFPTASTTFTSQQGKTPGWTLDNMGKLYFSDLSANCDKSRTSSVGGSPFWNFGDCQGDPMSKYGFSYSSAWYASVTTPLEIETKDITNLNNLNFLQGDPSTDGALVDGNGWGMDTTNTAAVNETTGIVFGWEIQRDGSDPFTKGQTMAAVTVGGDQPTATRHGGILWDDKFIWVGGHTVFNAKGLPNSGGDYIYMYSQMGNYQSLIVGRVDVDSAFNTSAYEFLKTDGTWDLPGTIPPAGTTDYGLIGTSKALSGPNIPWSDQEGSMMYNEYLGKYMLWVSMFSCYNGFFLSEYPIGPWSEYYSVLPYGGGKLYGSNVHPELLPGSNGQEILVSSGDTSSQTLFKLTLNY